MKYSTSVIKSSKLPERKVTVKGMTIKLTPGERRCRRKSTEPGMHRASFQIVKHFV